MSDNRVEQWKRKLLDLSMRNPLLNAREGRKFLPIKQGGVYSNAESETGSQGAEIVDIVVLI